MRRLSHGKVWGKASQEASAKCKGERLGKLHCRGIQQEGSGLEVGEEREPGGR